MSTVQTIINRSLRLIGALATGETADADETADALAVLNSMLSSWNNDKLMSYASRNITVPVTGGDNSYTIGASGADVSDTAPVRVDTAYIRLSGLDYPLELIDADKYSRVVDKTSASSIPEYLYFNSTHPNATVTLYPVPSEACTLYLNVWTPYTAYANTSTTFSMPDGYEDAIAYNLAVRLWPEYPAMPLRPEVVQLAKETLASIKRINRAPVEQVTQLGKLLGRNTRFNIYTDR